MFPLKTQTFSFQSNLTIEQLQILLATKVSKRKLISIKTDGQLYGTINDNNAIIELGQSFQRNSFRPVIVVKWTSTDSWTTISGYYRVSLAVIYTSLFLPLFGLYLTIKIANILPFLFCSFLWAILYLTIGLWAFNKDFKWTQDEFLKIFKT